MCIKVYLKGVGGSVAISNLREAFPNTKTSLSASSLPTGSAGRRGSRTEKRIQLAQPYSSPGATWPALCRFQHLLQDFSSSWFQASAIMKMRFALFCDIAQRTEVSGQAISSLKMGPIRCSETSLLNYHSTLRNNPEERRSLFFINTWQNWGEWH